MAATAGKDSDSLIDNLCKETYGYSFFHALRLMQSRFEGMPPIGDAMKPTDEPFRLKQSVSLNFAPSTLSSAEFDEERQILNLSVLFLGLTGPNGALPTSMTEYILERRRDYKDRTLENFLNVFHHRILTLFYKAWSLCNQAADSERRERSRFTRFFCSLQGLADESCRNRDHLSDEAKLYYSSFMNGGGRASEKLEGLLKDYFGLPIRVDEFVGHWLDLPNDATCRLGSDPETGVLGMSAIMGTKVWDRQQKFRIVIGPVTQEQMYAFLPSGTKFRELKDWVNYFIGLENDWDVQVVVKKEEVPMACLGENSYLGWASWMKSVETKEDRYDLIIGSN